MSENISTFKESLVVRLYGDDCDVQCVIKKFESSGGSWMRILGGSSSDFELLMSIIKELKGVGNA